MKSQRPAGHERDGVPARALAWWHALDRGWRATALGAVVVVVHVLAG